MIFVYAVRCQQKMNSGSKVFPVLQNPELTMKHLFHLNDDKIE